jgi:serine/threonine protein kinase
MLRVGEREGAWLVEDIAMVGAGQLLHVAHTSDDRRGMLRLFRAGEQGEAAAGRVADALAKLDHPLIPKLADRGQTAAGEPWVVMSFFEGCTLSDTLAFSPLELHRAGRIFEQVADALAHVHERGLLHRNISPDSIVVGDGDAITLIGFEHAFTAKGLQQAEDPTFGPVAYVAPEVLRLYSSHSEKADLYSLGIVLFEAVTGRTAFPAAMMDISADPRARARRWRSRDRELELGPDLPDWLAGLIRRSTAADPQRRFRLVDAVVGWLDAARNEWEFEEEGDAPSLAPPAPLTLGGTSLAPSIGMPMVSPSIGPPPAMGPPNREEEDGPGLSQPEVLGLPPAVHQLAAAVLGAISGGVVSFLVIAADQAG